MLIRRDVKEMSCRCARNAVFHYNRNDAAESKMMRLQLCSGMLAKWKPFRRDALRFHVSRLPGKKGHSEA